MQKGSNLSSEGDEAPLNLTLAQARLRVASPNLVLGLCRQARKIKVCIGLCLPQAEAGTEATVKFF